MAVGADPGATTAAASSSGHGFVGRQRELEALRAELRAAADRPSVVLLVGEAGIGKSRLADEAGAMASAAGMRVVYAEADPARREPMELWRGVYRGLHIEPPGEEALPAAERRWEHLEALAGALRASAPVMVVLDDLHWADDMAVWVLEHLPRAVGDARVVFLAASRDDEPGMPRLDGLRRMSLVVPLGGLDVEEVRQLTAVQPGRPVDAAELHARTGGNPLFVRELLQSPDGGGVIGEVLHRALTRFDAETQELLAAAALAGARTPLAVVAASASTTTARAADRLAAARRAGVLDGVSRTGVVFHHALLVDAAQRLLDPAPIHARLAAAWSTSADLDARTAAAGHRLYAAESPSDVADAVEVAVLIATELTTAGHQPRAVALLRDAATVSVDCIDRPELRATVLLELAELLAGLGGFDAALGHYQEAAQLARGGSDPLLRARAEIGAALHVNPFMPEPLRLRRLEDAVAALPPGELRLRAALLGRLAVIGGADTAATDQARAWADEAVTVARRTGDPVLIVQALLDRYIAPQGRQELEDQVRAAGEVIARADRAGRGDLVVQGHQWRFASHLNHGEVAAADRALRRAELVSELLPSPVWRYGTLVRRATLLALGGNRAAAMAAIDEAGRVGSGTIDPLAVLGFELGHRHTIVDLYGGDDARMTELYGTLRELVGDVPVPFLQVQLAWLAQVCGDHARIDPVLRRYADQPDLLLGSLGGDALVRLLGELVVGAGATQYVAPVYDALVPFAGLFNVGNGASAGRPVDDVLARLAMMAGDPTAAVGHATAAVALVRSMPAPPLLVHCLDHLADALERAGHDGAEAARLEAAALATAVGVERAGDQPGSTRASDATRPATMRRDGGGWVLTSPLGATRLPDSIGIRQLARLVSTPGADVTAIELAGHTGAPAAADLGPALDAQAKRAYRRRLLELQSDIDDAAACNDPVRGELAQVELDALIRELERAVGLGGRDRPTGSGAERARINVARSIKRAIEAIGVRAPDLGAHLAISVRTGRFCTYCPEPAAALTWTVDA